MNKRLSVLFLLFSILVAGFTHFYMLGEAPAGLYLDEAAQGYNAYSILKTGKDEFGKSFPIIFRSFTDFKTPVYIYILVPLVKLFGLTKFAVRLPSAIFSLLTFPFLFLLIKELAPNKKFGNFLAAITLLLLAISPWHVLFGRTNFETNIALFFFISGIYYLYKAKDKPILLVISALLLAIALPAYHSQRIITPIITAAIFLKNYKIYLAKTHKKYLFFSLVLGFLITLPTLAVSLTPGFLARASLNIFNYEKTSPAGLIESYTGFFSFIINSPMYLSTKEFLGLYLSYFSPRNMFILGDSGPRSSFPSIGTFYLWQFPFYLYGLWVLLKNKSLGTLRFLTLILLVVAPLPAALTRDPYSTIRSETLVIPQIIIISLGVLESWRLIKFKPIKVTAFAAFVVIFVYSILKLFSSGIVLNEHYRASYWNYGWEQVASSIENTNLPIVVDNVRTEPYSQLLFFLQVDPRAYQQENFEVPLTQYYTNMQRNKTKVIDNIVTRPLDWEVDIYTQQYLVGDHLSISDEQVRDHKLEVVNDITYPDWSLAFRVVKTNPQAKCEATFFASEFCQN